MFIQLYIYMNKTRKCSKNRIIQIKRYKTVLNSSYFFDALKPRKTIKLTSISRETKKTVESSE